MLKAKWRRLAAASLKPIAVAVAIFGFALGLTPGGAAAAKQEITVAFGVDPTSLNPLASTSIPGRSVINHIFDKLVWFDLNGNLIPKLAVSWAFIEPTVLELKLRDGVKWHNGKAFTAEDVKFTLDSIRAPSKPNWMTASFKPISEVKVVDPLTVHIITKAPNRSLLRNLSLVEVVSKAVFENEPDTVQTRPVGTGPFVFVSYTPGDRVIVERNPDYWGGAPRLERITVRVIQEAGTRLAELRSGNVDFIDNVPVDEIVTVEQQADLDLLAGPSLRVMYVALKTQRSPFDDPRVRHAAHYAIDKQAIVDHLLAGRTTVANTPVAPQIPGHHEGIDAWPHDPEKARSNLKDAGALGAEIVVAYPQGRYLMDKQVGEAIAGYLQAAGFTVKQESPEWGIYYTTLRTGNDAPYDVGLVGWGGDTGDPNWVLWEHFYSSSAAKQTGYGDEQVDRLLEEALQTLDEEKAMTLYREVQEIVVQDSSWIPLYMQPNVWAKNKRLKGFDLRPDEFIIFTNSYVE
ncbi:MAG: ABC transporter substrate-binding protein [Alphaproteobacteria bacterium]|nr:ABC transporter substrate-binding protein [Alphaproteobacteria bacterium]